MHHYASQGLMLESSTPWQFLSGTKMPVGDNRHVNPFFFTYSTASFVAEWILPLERSNVPSILSASSFLTLRHPLLDDCTYDEDMP